MFMQMAARRRRMGGFSPLTLFAASEPGAWLDPSDLSTLFQDDAGTTPVTAAGQSVGMVLDKSGRGNHATQPVFASRPIYQVDSGGRGYLSFDGTDDFLVTPAINFTATDKVQVFAGVRKLSDAARAILLEASTSSSSPGAFGLEAPSLAAANYHFTSTGTIVRSATYTNAAVAAPVSSVITCLGDISGDISAMRVNGVQVAQNTGDQGTGNYGNHALYIGMRGSTTLPFNGYLFGLIVRGAASNAAQIASTEAWLNQRTGAF